MPAYSQVLFRNKLHPAWNLDLRDTSIWELLSQDRIEKPMLGLPLTHRVLQHYPTRINHQMPLSHVQGSQLKCLASCFKTLLSSICALQNNYVLVPQKLHIAPRGNLGQELPNMDVTGVLQRKPALAGRVCLDNVFSCEGIVRCLCLQTNFTLLCNNHTAKTWHLILFFDYLKPNT